MSARLPRRQRGLTLIELMVALAIFAVLGVLSYRALAEVSTSRTRLEDGFERWRNIGRAMQRIDADLLQVVAPAAANPAANPATGPQASSNSPAAISSRNIGSRRTSSTILPICRRSFSPSSL